MQCKTDKANTLLQAHLLLSMRHRDMAESARKSDSVNMHLLKAMRHSLCAWLLATANQEDMLTILRIFNTNRNN